MGAAAAAGTVLAGSAFSAYESVQAGKAQSGYYGYLSSIAGINAGLAKAEGTAEVRQIGAREGQQQLALENRIDATVGAEKTAVVGGVGASSRSAQDIIKDTLNKGNLDEMALRYNSEVESKNALIGSNIAAMNYGSQAAGFNIAGNNARTQGNIGAISSMLGGAGSIANSWYQGSMYAKRNNASYVGAEN